jgi:hypothetical protein
MAAGRSQGSALQEGLVTVALRSAAVALVAGALLILWGLRYAATDQHDA